MLRPDFYTLVNFIDMRTAWLLKHVDRKGVLVTRDHRDEAGMLLRLIEELEREHARH